MKKLLVLVVVVGLIFAMTSCSGAGSDVVKIGVLSPTSGEGAVHGVPVANAAQLAADEINEAGGIDGKTIEIIAYDTKGEATEGVNAYNKLRDQDKVIAIVGGTYSGVTLGVKELAVADNMPMLSPTATNPDVTLDAPNIFRACYTDAYQGQVCAKFAIDSLGATKVGVLFNKDNAYSEGLATEFEKTATELGATVVVESFANGDKEFSAQLTKLEAEGIEALFIPEYANVVGPILTQMTMDIPALGADGWDGIIDDFADVAEGTYFANHYSTTDEAAIVQDFIKNYEAKYEETPNALGALAYDSVYLMAEAIETAGSMEADDIVSALAGIEKDGVTGTVTFDANGDPVKAVSMIKVVDGQLTLDSKVSAK